MLALGPRRHDVAHRALVMGILDPPSDPFFDLDACCRRAEQLVADGADVLDVGGVKAGPGAGDAGEPDRVVSAIESLHARFDVALSCDTGRASVARAAYAAGAVMGNDRSGFADPDYLRAAADAGASVVATHFGTASGIPDPRPHDDVLTEVCAGLGALAGRAAAAGLPRERILVDAGLDLGTTPEQSLVLLRGSSTLAAMGYPVVLSTSSTPFHAVGVVGGCRVLRTHDARAARRVADVLAAILAAGDVPGHR